MGTPTLAIIGGTGLDALVDIKLDKREIIITPFGEPSGPVTRGNLFGQEVLFLPRHGYSHSIAPHLINYRANIWALRDAGADSILAVAAVGGIRSDMGPGQVVIPDQIIDYSWGRKSTFFDGTYETRDSKVTHIDFTHPYSNALRQRLFNAASAAKIDVVDGGTYAATQGPRLETAAEITRLERDGCHLVGMTGMPEASLARELELHYACCAVVANWAAGKTDGIITMEEIETNLTGGMQQVSELIKALMSA
ncbi:MAG: S-methyl-5'-thioinosine phosphorylase [Ectothiorhodospiraceae bacterium]|nr:S-methyl-5'-thioinosine phosphorylase [Ectothiorhodospiraceae bacterium]